MSCLFYYSLNQLHLCIASPNYSFKYLHDTCLHSIFQQDFQVYVKGMVEHRLICFPDHNQCFVSMHLSISLVPFLTTNLLWLLHSHRLFISPHNHITIGNLAILEAEPFYIFCLAISLIIKILLIIPSLKLHKQLIVLYNGIFNEYFHPSFDSMKGIGNVISDVPAHLRQFDDSIDRHGVHTV